MTKTLLAIALLASAFTASAEVVNVDKMKVYSQPDASSQVVGTLAIGTGVKVYETTNGMAKIDPEISKWAKETDLKQSSNVKGYGEFKIGLQGIKIENLAAKIGLPEQEVYRIYGADYSLTATITAEGVYKVHRYPQLEIHTTNGIATKVIYNDE